MALRCSANIPSLALRDPDPSRTEAGVPGTPDAVWTASGRSCPDTGGGNAMILRKARLPAQLGLAFGGGQGRLVC